MVISANAWIIHNQMTQKIEKLQANNSSAEEADDGGDYVVPYLHTCWDNLISVQPPAFLPAQPPPQGTTYYLPPPPQMTPYYPVPMAPPGWYPVEVPVEANGMPINGIQETEPNEVNKPIPEPTNENSQQVESNS